MNNFEIGQLRVTWINKTWVITDPRQAGDPGVKVDSAVVNARHIGTGFVDGRIVSVHGLDFTVAQHLSRQQLSLLGVGSHLRSQSVARMPKLWRRVALLPDGRIEVCQP